MQIISNYASPCHGLTLANFGCASFGLWLAWLLPRLRTYPHGYCKVADPGLSGILGWMLGERRNDRSPFQ